MFSNVFFLLITCSDLFRYFPLVSENSYFFIRNLDHPGVWVGEGGLLSLPLNRDSNPSEKSSEKLIFNIISYVYTHNIIILYCDNKKHHISKKNSKKNSNIMKSKKI